MSRSRRPPKRRVWDICICGRFKAGAIGDKTPCQCQRVALRKYRTNREKPTHD